MKYFFLSVSLLFVAIAAKAQKLSLTGDNYLLLNGERFNQQKMVFTRASGDWYTTGKDGHGTIEFNTTYEGRPVTMDIEWDGSEEPHLVNDEIRHNGKRQAEFSITMADKASYGDGLVANTSGDDEIRISILKIDEMNVTGSIAGTVTNGSKTVKVEAGFNLKKTVVSKKMVSSAYKDCDNVVHDKLINAQDRSPSECEAKYDLDIRTAIRDALAPVFAKFQKDGWEVQSQTDLSPLSEVGRGSEKNIFSTNYELILQVSNTSPIYAHNLEKYNEYSEKLKSGTKEDFDRFVSFSREMHGSVKMEINFFVNNRSAGFGNYKGGTKITKLSPTLYKIESRDVQARTGGGADNAMDATFLLIGNWKQPVVGKEGDGSETVNAAAILDPTASHLQAQNIVIRMECNSSLADQFINSLDLQKLQTLISH